MGIFEDAVASAVRGALHKQLGGTLAGYAFVMTYGHQPLVEVSEGWVRAPWESDHPSTPFTTSTRSWIASLSKPITLAGILRMISDWNYVRGYVPTRPLVFAPPATAIAGTRASSATVPSGLVQTALAASGKLSLDSPILTLIKSKLTQTPASGTDAITLRNISGHRSGLNIDAVQWATGSEAELWSSISQVFATPMLSSGSGVDGQPGYRNEHYSILRGCLEAVTGEGYESYVKRAILEPAGARDASLSVEDDAVPMVYYSMDQATARVAANSGVTFGDVGWGAGPDGWFASARDLASLMVAFHDGGLVGLDAAARDDLFHRTDSGIATYSADTLPLYGHEGHWLWAGGAHSGVYSGIMGVSDGGLAAVLLLNGDDDGGWGYPAFAAAVQGALPVIDPPAQYQSGGVNLINVLGLGDLR